ncbi:hypothetical protein ACFQE0_13930 [Methylobacterium komagatae]|uniref:PspA/IM30 family protein n=1 Tax=Methylobacterium komagatae TaxID=374425 RepID=A0ABW2BL85_9HYPH
MSNPWSAPVVKPLSKLLKFIRVQMAGAPAADAEDAVDSIAEHFADEIRAAVEPLKEENAALRREIETLKGLVPSAASDATDLFAPIREEIAELRVALEKALSAAATPADEVVAAVKALHERVTALEKPRPAAAVAARAAAPAARPATTA